MERISRTQKKKNAERLQKLGKRLIDIDDAVLDEIGLADELRDAIDAARRIKQHEARRRQLQYIGRLMRETATDAVTVQSAIDRAEGRDGDQKRKFKQVETLRHDLLSGSSSRYEWLLKTYPQADAAHLKQLIRDAAGEKKRPGTKRAARALFRFLMQLID